MTEESTDKDRVLFIFSKENKLRKACFFLTESTIFKYVVLAIIIISSIFLAVENPLDSLTSRKTVVLNVLNQVVTVIFGVEIIIKVIATGLLFNGKDSYLRSYWNILDLLIVIIQIISVSV